MLREEVFAWLALTAFVLCAAPFLIKCGYEIAGRRLNVPKTLHMSLAAGLFFITPALQNLDVALQSLNTWHSFQYLAVVICCCRPAGGAKPRQVELPRRATVCCQGSARDRCHDGSADGDAEGQSKRSSVTMLEESMILMSLAAACRMER